jgi:ABC-type sugar transport system permease subunit
MVIALALAMFVQREVPGIGLVRGALFMPVVTAMVIASTLWKMMYHPTHGLFNNILATVGLPRLPFLTEPLSAVLSVVVFSLWKQVGYSMLFFLAGLKAIPEVYYEAALIDGASTWTSFRHITLPLLSRTVLFVLITTTIGTFRMFTEVFVMTLGGPRYSTYTIVYNIYKVGFVQNEMGYAAAISILLLLIVLTISLVQMRLVRTEFEY